MFWFILRYPARICKVNEKDRKALIHFEGWNHRYDEWISYDSDCLRPMSRASSKEETKEEREKVIFHFTFFWDSSIAHFWIVLQCSLVNNTIKLNNKVNVSDMSIWSQLEGFFVSNGVFWRLQQRAVCIVKNQGLQCIQTGWNSLKTPEILKKFSRALENFGQERFLTTAPGNLFKFVKYLVKLEADHRLWIVKWFLSSTIK